MPRAWEPDFDFYEARFEDTRVTLFLDLAARDHAPVATHPVRLHVRVEMRMPRPDGLRNEAESLALFSAEDTIVKHMETTHDAIYVGRVVTRGYTTWAFYVAKATARPLAGAPSIAPYSLEWTSEADPEWGYYREFLFPDDEAHADLLSRRAVDRLTRAGTPDGLN